MQDLPMQIRLLNRVAVDDPDRADAGAGEIGRGGASEAAGADDQDRCSFESGLACASIPHMDKSAMLR